MLSRAKNQTAIHMIRYIRYIYTEQSSTILEHCNEYSTSQCSRPTKHCSASFIQQYLSTAQKKSALLYTFWRTTKQALQNVYT